MTSITERALTFDCGIERLVGILHIPPTPTDTAVIIVVGGPQYRVGSHRQFVHLARSLSAGGFCVLRFDYRGMGDSSGMPQDFESVTDDIGAAIDAVQREVSGIRRIALWGLCDGASAALIFFHERRDSRVAGLCLVNPWVRSQASLARTHVKHYYLHRIAQRGFWLKLLRGRVAATAARGLLANLSIARSATASAAPGTYQDRMASAFAAFNGPLLLMLSGNDYTAKEFVEHVAMADAWAGAMANPRLRRLDLPNADHTFSDTTSRAWLERHTLEWLNQSVAEGDAREPRRACIAVTG